MQTALKIFSVFALMIVAGCATISSVPPGYDLDVTPEHDGSDWR